LSLVHSSFEPFLHSGLRELPHEVRTSGGRRDAGARAPENPQECA
jgi:hypothetical protein